MVRQQIAVLTALRGTIVEHSHLENIELSSKAMTARSKGLKGLLLVSTFLASGMVTGFAVAQETTDNVPEQVEEVTSSDTEEADDTVTLGPVSVVGSRLRNTSISGDLPIEVLSAEVGDLLGAGSTVELIRQSTLLTGSQQSDGQQSLVFIGGRSVDGGNGSNTLSLRGLGSERTLVLLDGKRLSPSGFGGGVASPNISILPSTIISQVEILKDGASSIYGSDAIAGIVDNRLIGPTDENILTGNFNITEQGGAEFFQIAGRWSKTFDKGHINIAAQFDSQESLAIKDRDYTDCRDPRLTDPVTGQRVDIRNANGNIVCTSFGTNNRFFFLRGGTGSFFDPDSINARFSGLYVPDPNGVIIGPGQDELRGIIPEFARVGITNLGRTSINDPFFGPAGGDFEQVAASNALLPQTSDIIQNSNAQNPEDRYSLFASGAYEVSDSVEAYGHALLSRVETDVSSFRFLYEYLGADHPSNTVSERIQTATGGALFGSLGFNIHRPYVSSNETDYAYVVGGLRGQFSDTLPLLGGWDWDIFAQYGNSDASYTENFTRQDRLDAVTGFTNVGCDPTLINVDLLGPGETAQGLCDSIGGAIPWLDPRILRDGQLNAAELAFLEGTETGSTTYEQVVLEGFVSGEVRSFLEAGDISVAVGFHLQHDQIDDMPGPNARAFNNHNFSNSQPTAGHSALQEVFAEVGVPLIEDQPGFDRLYLSASGRFTDNSRVNDGGASTYKVSLAWNPVEQLKLRTSFGTSYRAPALFELFQGGSESFGASDPCDDLQNSSFGATQQQNLIQNCGLLGLAPDFQSTVNIRTLNQGNSTGTLEPETSESFNAGIVFSPDSLDLDIAIDYYDIQIENQIGRVGGQSIINRCLVEQSFDSLAAFGADQFCALLGDRDADGNLPFVINGSINVAEQSARGIDYSAQFNHEFGAYEFGFDGTVTQVLEDFLNEDRGVFDPVNDDIDRTLVALRPEFTGNFNLSLSRGPFTGFWNILYIGSSDQLDFERTDPNTDFADDGTQQFFGAYRFLDPLLTDTEVEEYIEHSMSVRYEMNDSLSFFVGIRNVFDQEPPQVGGFVQRVGTSASGPYDFRGRRLFVRATKTF